MLPLRGVNNATHKTTKTPKPMFYLILLHCPIIILGKNLLPQSIDHLYAILRPREDSNLRPAA